MEEHEISSRFHADIYAALKEAAWPLVGLMSACCFTGAALAQHQAVWVGIWGLVSLLWVGVLLTSVINYGVSMRINELIALYEVVERKRQDHFSKGGN